MIIDLDPLFTSTLAYSGSRFAAPAVSGGARRHGRHTSVQTRAEREAQFERTHGSLWVPGVLDRLTLPLTRFHE